MSVSFVGSEKNGLWVRDLCVYVFSKLRRDSEVSPFTTATKIKTNCIKNTNCIFNDAHMP